MSQIEPSKTSNWTIEQLNKFAGLQLQTQIKWGSAEPLTIENLRNICENWLEDLRYSQNTLYGDSDPSTGSGTAGGSGAGDIPIIISSGYRSEEVNMKCGGAKNSNHLTGCAVDIKCYGPEQMIRMAGILLDIADGTKRDFDELILEKRGTTYWIHFAVRPKDNRRKILFDCR